MLFDRRMGGERKKEEERTDAVHVQTQAARWVKGGGREGRRRDGCIMTHVCLNVSVHGRRHWTAAGLWPATYRWSSSRACCLSQLSGYITTNSTCVRDRDKELLLPWFKHEAKEVSNRTSQAIIFGFAVRASNLSTPHTHIFLPFPSFPDSHPHPASSNLIQAPTEKCRAD